MLNTKFEVYKVSREIRRSGKEYEFDRIGTNEYGEPLGGNYVVGRLRGLYHEKNEHISVTMGDTTRIRSKKVPSILCLYNDVVPLQLSIGDKTTINGKDMKVTGIVNVQEWDLIADVSLEVVDSGV